MRGDFSRWRDERRFNFNGVLHQQGRVLLDGDWNAQTNLTNDWQDTSGRDAFGPFVAAVPSEVPDSFKIKSATLTGGAVHVTLAPGRLWADGLLVRLDGAADIVRLATYLQPPIAPVPPPLAAGDRDAVILEVWREEMNGFQMPEELIEPALGGPDTTERVHTAMALRLFRMTDPDDTCESIVDGLQDDFDAKGKLTVTLDAPVIVGGDCPVTDDGGYTGFEHNLYRVEIAETNSGAAMFKWSQFGGGLVGRGKFDAAARTLTIDAGDQAIINSGLQQFYLEAYEFDPASPGGIGVGHWRVIYGASVTLNSATGVFSLPLLADPGHVFGTAFPGPATASHFFRLWNGIEPIADFDGPAPLELQDGILLEFDPATASNYKPGDYWTFDVRAGDIGNTTPLVDNEPPEGIHYHRVPLGVLTWTSPPNPPEIEDCRRPFHPLTKRATCCTYSVGDGRASHGDFTSIQAAVDALPASGGEVCVLPGLYEENVRIAARRNVTIKGCGRRTRVRSLPPAGGATVAAPVFHIIDSQHIKILSLAVEAHASGIGIRLEGPELFQFQPVGRVRRAPLVYITLEELFVRAAAQCAIHAEVCFFTTIRRCRVEMDDVESFCPAVFFLGDDGLIEENYLLVPRVVPQRQPPVANFNVNLALTAELDDPWAGRAERALGGLQLGGGSERVRVLHNFIVRGIGTGIKLGHLRTVTTTGEPVPDPTDRPRDPCFPCRPGDNSVPDPGQNDTTRTSAGPPLYDIEIVCNRIYSMGLDGIGVAGFFNLAALDEFITVNGLLIDSNEIRFCLNRPLAEIADGMLKSMGYGGIALADVSDLVVRDNFITDNGPDFTEPICGIFVLHGEGIEISRNHILNNGVKPPGARLSNAAVKRGARGGIHVMYAVAPLVELTLSLGANTTLVASNTPTKAPVHGGFPALKVHDNVVGVPVGRALSATAVGPVSVVGNQFTTRGVTQRDFGTFVAATVMITNLGLSNEFYLQLVTFALLLDQNVKTQGAGQPGLDDKGVGKFLLGGNVLFAANQCSLDLFDTEVSAALTSVFIASLDDVGFHDNQSDCNLFGDLLLFNVGLFAISVRMSDNRLKESLSFGGRGGNTGLAVNNPPAAQRFSAITIGLFNTTTDNQSTHCLLILGLPNLTVDHSNVSLVMLNNPTACCRFLVHKDRCFGQQPPQ
ncbi:MAG TPA: DUF6519 domain-containing protein [Pyrinomonadaceae bacterium]|nr:DUF6519 domain-containing protein [Pyrinomonadaceae bacterium]